MSDDLVKRLRSKIIVHTDAAVWMLEAADRIKELEAKLTKVIAIVEERHVIHMTGKGRNPADYISMWSVVADEIRELAELSSTMKGQDDE